MTEEKFRVYIASSFDFIEGIKTEIIPLIRDIWGDQLQITRDWWANNVDLDVKHDDTSFPDFLGNGITRALCELDFSAIDISDIVIVYNPRVGKRLTGALIEAGYAWGKGKTVYLYGWFKKSAILSRGIYVNNENELKTILKLYKVGYDWNNDGKLEELTDVSDTEEEN